MPSGGGSKLACDRDDRPNDPAQCESHAAIPSRARKLDNPHTDPLVVVQRTTALKSPFIPRTGVHLTPALKRMDPWRDNSGSGLPPR
jgi:hypothetical protein